MYTCNHDITDHGTDLCDVFMYSLRIKKTHETYMTFMNEKGKRIKSSFKKINNNLDFNVSEEEIEYSSAPRDRSIKYIMKECIL